VKVRVDDVDLYFDVDGASLHAEGRRLTERPTLLLLHGGPGADHNYFKPIFSAMTDVAQVVYLDQRGHGRSDRCTLDRMTLETWADDVRGFCEALHIEKPVVLGNSFGAEVAMAYATRHPGHPGKLVLDGGAARLDLDAILAVFERLGGTRAREVAAAFWTSPFDPNSEYMTVCLPLYTRRQDEAAFMDSMLRTTWNPELTGLYLERLAHQIDFRADLPKIACPTLVLAGADDPVAPLDSAREIADAIDPALVRLEVFEGCGHGAFREDPDRAFAVLREFVCD
jgi:proline iminopeptidase